MSEISYIGCFLLVALAALALFVRREEKIWGGSPSLALPLAALAMLAFPFAIVAAAEGSWLLGALLALLALAAFPAGALMRGLQPLALLATFSLLALPALLLLEIG